MFLGLVFIVSSLVSGWTIIGPRRWGGWQRAGFAVVVGFTFSSWLTLLLALALGRLDSLTVGMSMLVLLGAVFFLNTPSPSSWRWRWERFRMPETLDRVSVVSVLVVLYFIFYINIFDMFTLDENGYLQVMEDAWADQALHIGLIEYLAREGSFALNYPAMAGVPLAYPFMADFLSAILLKTGFSLRSAVVVPNILLGTALVLGVYTLACRVGRKKNIAAAAVLLFFFNGGLGFYYALAEPALRDYTHITEHQLVFENIIEHFLFSQRSILLGLGVSVAVYTLLAEVVLSRGDPRRELLLAGTLTGLLPLIHSHSFIAVSIVSLFVFLHKPSRVWLYFILPFILFSTPQLLRIEHQSGTGFLHLSPGWVPENNGKNLLEIAWFWVKNTGFPPLLALGGWLLAEKRIKIFYLPFAAIFLVANIFVFQPNPYDNNKLFLHWLLPTAILAAIFLDRLYHWQAWHHRWYIPLLVVSLLLFFSILAGLITNMWAATTTYGLYSPQELEMGEWIKNNTHPDAIFLTGFSNQNPVFLAGRQILLGSWWYTASHFLDRSELERDIKRIYTTGDCKLIKKHRIDYILISPKESDLNPNPYVFETKNFQPVYTREFTPRDFIIYKTKCSQK